MARRKPTLSSSAGRRTAALICSLTGAALPAVVSAASIAQGEYYERVLMSRADARCHLFPQPVEVALWAARDEARGAALRAGDSPAAVDATGARAVERADAVDCRAPGLQKAAQRLRDAYAGYAQMSSMRFPGARSAWVAERADARLKGPRWSLVEPLPSSGGWVLFGQVDGAPALLDARRGAPPAAGVRLVLRDPSRWSQPVLANQPPAGAASLVLLAKTRGPAATALLPAGARSGTLYRFAPTALDALARLDPRETARVELVYPAVGRDSVVAFPLEVGDVAAARAFLSAGAPPR